MTGESNKAALLDARYGGAEELTDIAWTPQIEAMLTHRSVRFYRPDLLPEGAIEAMVASAQSASTSSNLHQWSVVAITDPDLKARIAEDSRVEAGGVGNPYIEQAPVFLLWIADLSANHAIATENGGSGETHDYLDAFLMASIDAAVASQNAALAAESLGLGTVYIGGMRNRAKQVAEMIGLPRYSFVAFGMVVGWPDPSKLGPVRPRPRQSAVLHWNRYDRDRSLSALRDYDEVWSKFTTEQGLRDPAFVETVKASANKVEWMHGRQNLRSAVDERGFKLR